MSPSAKAKFQALATRDKKRADAYNAAVFAADDAGIQACNDEMEALEPEAGVVFGDLGAEGKKKGEGGVGDEDDAQHSTPKSVAREEVGDGAVSTLTDVVSSPVLSGAAAQGESYEPEMV